MQTISENLTFPTTPPNVPPLPRRAQSDPITILDHPRVSSVNANFEYTLNGQTVREALDDMFHSVSAVPDRPVSRRKAGYGAAPDQQSQIDVLAARVAALEEILNGCACCGSTGPAKS